MDKKLQVFISSTYTDLIEERQAAVQATLDAGHIPAGMELFKAGNESQLQTIYKWIDASDVYMLILGGRYGSIEPTSGKSYTQLEYEYAQRQGIPLFAVVLSESFLKNKINTLGIQNVLEQAMPTDYNSFKKLVMSKIIREVDDCKDIKLTVHSTLNQFLNEYNLTGWIRSTPECNPLKLLEDNATLTQENMKLKEQIQKLKGQSNAPKKFGGFSFEELTETLKKKIFIVPAEVARNESDVTINALKLFLSYYNVFSTGVSNEYGVTDEIVYIYYHIAPYYLSFSLLEKRNLPHTSAQQIQISKTGSLFYAMLQVQGLDNT